MRLCIQEIQNIPETFIQSLCILVYKNHLPDSLCQICHDQSLKARALVLCFSSNIFCAHPLSVQLPLFWAESAHRCPSRLSLSHYGDSESKARGPYPWELLPTSGLFIRHQWEEASSRHFNHLQCCLLLITLWLMGWWGLLWFPGPLWGHSVVDLISNWKITVPGWT